MPTRLEIARIATSVRVSGEKLVMKQGRNRDGFLAVLSVYGRLAITFWFRNCASARTGN
jgi:hypothetical protein